jgi:hypothetical protein
VPFRYALFLEDGEPADPAVFVTATPSWNEGDVFLPRGGERFRIVAIEPDAEILTGCPKHDHTDGVGRPTLGPSREPLAQHRSAGFERSPGNSFQRTLPARVESGT